MSDNDIRTPRRKLLDFVKEKLQLPADAWVLTTTAKLVSHLQEDDADALRERLEAEAAVSIPQAVHTLKQTMSALQLESEIGTSLFSKAKESSVPLTALVVAVALGGEVNATIAYGTPLLLEDVDENYGSRDAADSLGDPPGAGIWIWEGGMQTRQHHEGDYDVDYVGAYRPIRDDEVVLLREGKHLAGWEETRANDGEEG